MASDQLAHDVEDWHNFQIHSRREIIAILRTIENKNQLVRLLISGEADVAVTSILEVDGTDGEVIIDCSINREQNTRILAASRLTLETTLDKIRILFSVNGVDSCMFKGRPAFSMEVPESLIRLQRRELYRMETPLTNPVRCVITLPEELGGGNHAFPLADISGGGVALLDEKMLLDNTLGTIYPKCRIDLPALGVVETALQIRSSHDMKLLNGKVNRRLGCQFREIHRQMLDRVQRYITKLERDRNSRANGLA